MNTAVEHALCRSALWEALALGFRPPGMETCARLASPAAAGLAAAAEALGGAGLAEPVRHLAETDLGTLGERYARLFGHTARGEVPLHETEYGAADLFQQPHALADLGGFYAAFGLVLVPAAGERVDHLSCECEFLMFLARKEAHALACADRTMADAARHATRLFLRDHLARFVPAVAARLARTDAGGFYGTLGVLAERVVATECERLEVAAGPPTLGLRLPVEDRIPMACGTCPLGAPEGIQPDGD